MATHNGKQFTTNDVDNDRNSSVNCARHVGGGWWYANCVHGIFTSTWGQSVEKRRGIRWNHWPGVRLTTLLKYADMKIRVV